MAQKKPHAEGAVRLAEEETRLVANLGEEIIPPINLPDYFDDRVRVCCVSYD